jgi:hypothetical protein
MSMFLPYQTHTINAGIAIISVALGTLALPYAIDAVLKAINSILGADCGVTVLCAMVYSPLAAIGIVALWFAVDFALGRSTKQGGAGIFVCLELLWGAVGLALAFVGVVLMTIITSSPQGPIVLIFYGPAGLAVGILVGVVTWHLRMFVEA